MDDPSQHLVMYAKLMREQGKGGFGYDYYWSSSEYDYYDAWLQFLYYGGQAGSNKAYYLRVRPVRAF